MASVPETGYEEVLHDLDAAALAPRVRAVVGSETVAVDDWSFERVGGGVSELSGNAHYRLSGTARGGDETEPWSVVCKVHNLSDRETLTERESSREIGFYRSAVSDRAWGGFRPVRCLDVQSMAEPASCWLWLADLDDAFDGAWPLEQFERAARHLGQFNGAFLGDLPTGEWFRPYEFEFDRTAPVVAALSELPGHPGLERGLPPAVRGPLRRVWDLRSRLLDRQASLPQTFCHLDPTPGNLFARRAGDGWETVAIDWEFCGRGPLGADAALLVAASPVARHADVRQLPELDDVVFEAYLDGLGDAGWRGERASVRAGYVNTMVVHWLESIGELRRPYLDPATGEAFEHLFDVSRETWLATMGDRARFLADRAEEAAAILDGSAG